MIIVLDDNISVDKKDLQGIEEVHIPNFLRVTFNADGKIQTYEDWKGNWYDRAHLAIEDPFSLYTYRWSDCPFKLYIYKPEEWDEEEYTYTDEEGKECIGYAFTINKEWFWDDRLIDAYRNEERINLDEVSVIYKGKSYTPCELVVNEGDVEYWERNKMVMNYSLDIVI